MILKVATLVKAELMGGVSQFFTKTKLLSWDLKGLNEGISALELEICSENRRQTLFVFSKLSWSISLVALCIACGVVVI